MPYRSDPYANLGSTFNDLTRNLLTLRGQSMQQALSEAELQMRGNQFQETQRHNLALEEAVRAQTAKDPNIMPMNRVDVLRTKVGMKSSLGLDDKDLNDIYEPILGMSGAPRGQVYDTLKAQGPDMRNLLLQRVSDVYEKKLSDPKTGMTYAQSPQAKAMEEFISHLDGDADLGKTIDSLFPDVARARADELAKRRAAQTPVAVIGPEGKPMYMSAEEAMQGGYEKYVPGSEKQSIGNVQAHVITKWLEGQRLAPQEQKIIDKYFRGEKDTYGDSRMRWKAKVDAFEESIGRKASAEEKRRLFISDPYGILAPPGETGGTQRTYLQTATGKNGQKIGWDGTHWYDINTGALIQ